MLANQLSLPENRARETIGAAACSAGVRIVEDSLGVGAVPAAPGDCKAALFWAASYGVEPSYVLTITADFLPIYGGGSFRCCGQIQGVRHHHRLTQRRQ